MHKLTLCEPKMVESVLMHAQNMFHCVACFNMLNYFNTAETLLQCVHMFFLNIPIQSLHWNL